jgi:NADH dehydrogenase
LAPGLPLIGGGKTKFTPLFVGDLAEAIATLVDRGEASGQTFEFGGLEVFTFKQLMEFTLATIGRKRLLVPVPWFIAKVMGTVMGYIPGAPLTADQVELLKTDNVVSDAASSEGRDLASLGISAQGIQGIVPSYLYRYRKAGQFTAPKGMPE